MEIINRAIEIKTVPGLVLRLRTHNIIASNRISKADGIIILTVMSIKHIYTITQRKIMHFYLKYTRIEIYFTLQTSP